MNGFRGSGWIWRQIKFALDDRRGNILALTAVSVCLLMGFVGLALDGGNMILQRRAAQTAADCAALAGAHEVDWATNDHTTVKTVAQNASSDNGFADGSNGVTVTVNTPPSAGPHATDVNFVEVIVQRNVPTLFMALLNQKSLIIKARAVAGPGANAGCVYTLATSGTGLSAGGSAAMTLTNCTIYDDSSTPNTALTNGGAGTVTASSINVVGGYTGSFTPTPTTGVIPVGDPLAFLPEPTIPGTCNTYSGSSSLSPGCYSGMSLGSQATVTLNPGLYIMTGNLQMPAGATLNGNGVTLYFAKGYGIAMNGHPTINLSPPSSGTYKDIVYFQSRSDTGSVSFQGSSGINISGIFYAPNSSFSFSGNSGMNVTANFVVKSLSLGGNAGFSNYHALNGESPLSSITLSE